MSIKSKIYFSAYKIIEKFCQGYAICENGIITNRVSPKVVPDRGMAWRDGILAWAAKQTRDVPGDIVECGVYLGGSYDAFRFVCDPAKTIWLMDTWSGPCEAMGPSPGAIHYDDMWPAVQGMLNAKNVKLIRGTIPETLNDLANKGVSLLHIDLNCAKAEKAALDHFMPQMVTGSIIVHDDYACPGFEEQKEMLDRWASEHHRNILSSPTGVGVIVI